MSRTKIDGLGMKKINNKGLEMEIIAYRNNNDIDVLFKNDGTILEHKKFCHFINGTMQHPKQKEFDYIGKENVNIRGFKMKIIAYRGNDDIDVEFVGLGIVHNKRLWDFNSGHIPEPNYCKTKSRIGEKKISKCGFEMEIIGWRNRRDIDVKYSNGKIVEHTTYPNFLNDHVKIRDFAKEKVVGLKNVNNNGFEMEIIAYHSAINIDVEFKGLGIVYGKTLYHFQKGGIREPRLPRINEESVSTSGMKMKIIAYRKNKDMDVKFEDGTIVEHVRYKEFLNGHIENPNFTVKDLNKKKIFENKYLGKTFKHKNGLEFEVIDYKDSLNLTVKFKDGYIVDKVSTNAVEGNHTSFAHPLIKWRGGAKVVTYISEDYFGYKIKSSFEFNGKSFYEIYKNENFIALMDINEVYKLVVM